MSAPKLTPFHLAIPVVDLPSSRQFYGELLGCPEGRSAEQWVDFNLFGHQVVCHVQEMAGEEKIVGSNPAVPISSSFLMAYVFSN